MAMKVVTLLASLVYAQPGPHPHPGPVHCGYDACPATHKGKINVHLVPHSHDDTGWLKTVDQYFYGVNNTIQGAGVQYVIDTVITELEKAPDRKFVFVEIAFLWRWYREATDQDRQRMHHLVNTGQFEFLLGGWCMNDEAASHYSAMLEQNGLGLQWLRATFGECGRPHGAWQIDPFGHSKGNAELFALMGYDSVYFARMDYQEYDQRAKAKEIEMIWRGNDDFPGVRDLFTGGLVHTSYGPPSGFSWHNSGFDSPAIVDNNRSDAYNLEERVALFMDHIKDYQSVTQEGNIMMTMGSDFNYADALPWYKNMDKLIHHVNRMHGDKVHVMYSTPACYTKARHDSGFTNWTVKNDDFFPYSNGPDGQYWSGCFTSRPSFKGYIWDTIPVLQMCHHANLRSNARHGQDNEGNEIEFTLSRAFGVGQHHDGISGTEKQHVVDDYSKQVFIGREGCKHLANKVFQETYAAPSPGATCDYLNITVCDAIKDKDAFTVGVYSPASHAFDQHIRLPVSGSAYKVTDAKGNFIPVDVVPVSKATDNIRRTHGNEPNELWFTVRTSPMDLVTYHVEKASGNQMAKEGDDNSITNGQITLTFGDRGVETLNGAKFENQLMWFNSSQGYGQNSGAYIFRPNKTDPYSINDKPTVTITKGKNVQVAEVVWSTWASQVYRLWAGVDYVQVEWSVGPIPIKDQCDWNPKDGCSWGKEIISRYTTDIQAQTKDGLATVWTDTSGRNRLKRVKDTRPSFVLNTTDAETGVAGNYYPINSVIAVEDDKKSLSILVDRAQAGGSMRPGSIDLMMHRRITQDDHRGVGEPLLEPGQFGDGLMVRGNHYIVPGLVNDVKHKTLEENILQKPQVFFWDDVFHADSKPLINPRAMPSDVKIIALQKHFEPHQGRESILMRVENLYQKSDNIVAPVELQLDQLMNEFHVQSAHLFMAGGDVPVEAFKRFEWKTSEDGQQSVIEEPKSDCTLDKLCLLVQPGDLHTVVMTGTHRPSQ